MQVVGLGPHALQARAEVLLEQLAPLLALHAAPAPVQLEQHVGVEVGVELVAVDLDLAHAPERRLGDRDVGAHGGAHGVVGGVEHLLLLAHLAQARGGLADLLDELAAALGLDQAVHHGQALERVLAVEDARVVLDVSDSLPSG